MRVTVDVPPEIEQLLVKKCEKTKTEPSELIKLMLEWYFLKFRKSKNGGGSSSGFLKVANECSMERVKNCRYSDGENCAREVFNDIMAEKDPEPIVPYKCLFCNHFIDRRESKTKPKTRRKELLSQKEDDAVDQTYEVARIAAKMVVQMYSDKLSNNSNSNSNPKYDSNEMDEVDQEPITKNKVEKLLEKW
ncbi:MAG: hypothetical protein R6U44_09655 [Archaeoglobaceae archaeon]